MSGPIEAHMRMEERYEGLCLRYGPDTQTRQRILDAIEEAKRATGLKPVVFENISKEHDKDAIYIEFHDDYKREAGPFFEAVLHHLNTVCEKDC
ncbi:hypothetical protein [Nitratifractor sp.]